MATGYPHLLNLGQKQLHKPPLRFRADGTFHILHLSDIHLMDPEMKDDDPRRTDPVTDEARTFEVLEKSVQLLKPDLAVVSGDVVNGYLPDMNYNYLYRIIRKVTDVFARQNIPLAVTFGNHDSELNFHREIQTTMYMEYDGFRGTFNAEDMHGCGNCFLPILSRNGTNRKTFGIWLIDSGDYIRDENAKILGGYDYVHESQIRWYEKTAAALKAENGGAPLPSILFQHIPVQQEYDLIRRTDAPVPNTNGFTRDGKYWYIPDAISGRLREPPCPPAGDHREQFDSWVKTGDVLAAFFGHDHVNDFVVEKDGILLVQTLCAGQFTYGRERGCRSITLHEDDPQRIETESIEILPD